MQVIPSHLNYLFLAALMESPSFSSASKCQQSFALTFDFIVRKKDYLPPNSNQIEV